MSSTGNRRRSVCIAVAAMLTVLFAIPAFAQVTGGPGAAKPRRPGQDTSSRKLQIAATVGVGTDYVSRGVSQTANGPLGTAGVELGLRGFYAGATAFHVDFRREGNRASDAEIDLYGGYETQAGGQAIDVGVLHYVFTPGPAGQPATDYTEIYAKTGRAIGPVNLSGSIYYTGQGGGHTGTGVYGVAAAGWAIDKRWTASALLGHQTVGTGGSYTDWNAGVTRALGKRFTVDLRYWDTDHHRISRDYGSKLVLSANATF